MIKVFPGFDDTDKSDIPGFDDNDKSDLALTS